MFNFLYISWQNKSNQLKSNSIPTPQVQEGSQPPPQSDIDTPVEDDFILVARKKKKGLKENPRSSQHRNTPDSVPRLSSSATSSSSTPSSSSSNSSSHPVSVLPLSDALPLESIGSEKILLGESKLSQPDDHESNASSKEQDNEIEKAEDEGNSDNDFKESEMKNLIAIPTVTLNEDEQKFLDKVLDISGEKEQSSLDEILSTHVSSKCKAASDIRIVSDMKKQQNDDDSEDDGTWITPENVNTIFMGFEQEKTQPPKVRFESFLFALVVSCFIICVECCGCFYWRLHYSKCPDANWNPSLIKSTRYFIYFL